MGLFSKAKNKFSKIAISFSLLLATVAGVFGISNVGWSAQGSNLLESNYKNALVISYNTSDENHSSWSLSGDTLSGKASGYRSWFKDYLSNSTVFIQNDSHFNVSFKFELHSSNLASAPQLSPAGYAVSDDVYSVNLKKGSYLSCKIESKSGKGNDGTATLKFLNVVVANPIVSFETSDFGTYSVNGEMIQSAGKKITISEATTFHLKLESTTNGYSFAGWKLNNKTISSDPEISLPVEENCVIKPYFKNDSYATFKVGQTTYDDFAEAISVAQSGNDKNIIAAKSGEIPAGEYSIPSGVSFYIPNDESSYADYKKDVGSYATSSTALSLYRKITLANGCKITCQGSSAIVVCCKILASSAGIMSNPVGPYGEIAMEIGSKITLESGSALYAWGFISGSDDFVDPAIEAKSGSTVYEMFQITRWRGGTASSGMVDNENKVFLFNQYYVQNIEVPLKINAGAVERATAAVSISIKIDTLYRQVSFVFIGDSNEGMFRLSEGSFITKRYHKGEKGDTDADRIQFFLSGNGSLKNIEFTVGGLGLGLGDVKVKSQNYILPIGSNFDISVETGTTTIGQGIAILPDANIRVAQGASVTIAADTYLYNLADWKGQGFGYNCDLAQVSKISSGSPISRTLKTGATMDINGSVTVAAGAHLYCTSGTLNSALNTVTNQAKVISSKKTGSIIFTDGKAANSITYQAVQGSEVTYTSIPVENARLYNGNLSEYEGAIHANEKIPYSTIKDMWGDATHKERTGLYLQDDGKIAYYNTKGIFETKTGIFYYDSAVYPCGDNEYYLLTNGFVEVFKGIYRDSSSTSYYFFGEANIAYRNGIYSITNTAKLGSFFPGSYKFDSNGKLLSVTSTGDTASQLTKYVEDDKLMMDGVVAGIGLFELSDGYIYCANDNGSIVKNSTYYVNKTNGVKDAKNGNIKVGLYWFDANGHLCDSSLQPIRKGS